MIWTIFLKYYIMFCLFKYPIICLFLFSSSFTQTTVDLVNVEHFKSLSKWNAYQSHVKNFTKIQMAMRLGNVWRKRKPYSVADSSWQWEEIRGRASGKKQIPRVSVLSNAVLSQNGGCKQGKISRDKREIHKIGVKKAALIISQGCCRNSVKFQREKLFGEVRILYVSGVIISFIM